MSLRAFHVCFIVLSSSLALGFGLWSLQNLEPQGAGRLGYAAAGFLVAGCLLGYGSWFVRKMRDPRQP